MNHDLRALHSLSDSAKIALVVGIILSLINHYPAIFSGTITTAIWIKFAMNFLVPFMVATYSRHAFIRKAEQFLNCEPLSKEETNA